MGRLPKYDESLLMAVVGELLPDGALGWKSAAEHYFKNSGEERLRDYEDVKKHWVNVSCNKMNKPTGKTGDSKDRILRCQLIQKEILQKNAAYAMDSDDDDDDDDYDAVQEANDIEEEEPEEPDLSEMPQMPPLPALPEDATPHFARSSVPTTTPAGLQLNIPTTSVAKKQTAEKQTAPYSGPKTKNMSNVKRGNVLSSIDKLAECISNDSSKDNNNNNNNLMMMMMMNNMNNNNTRSLNQSGEDQQRILNLERSVNQLQFELETLGRKVKRLETDTEDEFRRLKKAKHDMD